MTEMMSLTAEELEKFVRSMGLPAFRAKQIGEWLIKGVDFSGMTNLPEKTQGFALRRCPCATGQNRTIGPVAD